MVGGEATARGETMRGMIWNSEKDLLNAKKKVKKAIDKGFLVSEYENEHTIYFFDNLVNPMTKRNTKGYYYALSQELFSIIQKFCIFADTETIDKIKASKLKELNDEVKKL